MEEVTNQATTEATREMTFPPLPEKHVPVETATSPAQGEKNSKAEAQASGEGETVIPSSDPPVDDVEMPPTTATTEDLSMTVVRTGVPESSPGAAEVIFKLKNLFRLFWAVPLFLSFKPFSLSYLSESDSGKVYVSRRWSFKDPLLVTTPQVENADELALPLSANFWTTAQKGLDELRGQFFEREKQLSQWTQRLTKRETALNAAISRAQGHLGSWEQNLEEMQAFLKDKEAQRVQMWADLKVAAEVQYLQIKTIEKSTHELSAQEKPLTPKLLRCAKRWQTSTN